MWGQSWGQQQQANSWGQKGNQSWGQQKSWSNQPPQKSWSNQSGPPVKSTINKEQPADEVEAKKRIDRTITWYNKYGGLAQPMDWQKVSIKLKKIPYKHASRILHELGQQAATVKNPTSWVVSKCNELGAAGSKGCLKKIGKTVHWWNTLGGLEAMGKPLEFAKVVEPLSRVDSQGAMRILKEMGEKKDTLRDPTSWVIAYVNKLEGEGMAYPSPWKKYGGGGW
eukprot:TRINITY_DN8880_c0_g1_i1.p1 TRINITY_DN8880_c0_g1~~TRINITY_DN8880_c0_g1_i1.p1  ORF type:complete len:224 (+),score=57.13 TRINITY_DN8880_c0_g1_i1:55-726(+)